MQFVTPRFSTIPRRLASLLNDSAGCCLGLLSLLLALGVGLGQQTRAQVPQKIVATSENINGLEIDDLESAHTADLNGNGKQNIIIAFRSGISWYENRIGEDGADSDGFGRRRTITTEVFESKSVFAADLDGDGDKDVLSASQGDNKIAWYENQIGEEGNGGSAFGDQQILTTDASDAQSVYAADVDGDGSKDVLSASQGSDKIAWYENQIGDSGADDDGFGSESVISDSADGTQSVYAADLDGDGDKDVLANHFDKVVWHENQVGDDGADDDGFGGEQVISTASFSPNSVYATDLDGDGDKDVLAGGDGKVAWHKNQIGEDGADSDGFGDQQVITTEVDGVESIYAADLDGNNKKDVLSVSISDDKLAWYENQTGESDADSDGFGDQEVINSVPDQLGSVYAADLDGDGDKDPLSTVSPFSGGDRVSWHENQIGEEENSDYGEGREVSSGADGAQSVHAADLDGDGDKDLLSAERRDHEITWYENRIGESGADSDGFGYEHVISTEAGFAESVYAADLDGDEDKDVLFASSSSDDKIAWHENKIGEADSSNEKFGDQQIITSNVSSAQSVYAADLDGDGKKDILSASRGDDTVAWYKNQIGNSSTDDFGAQQVVNASAIQPTAVYAVDLDGDGDQDILSASRFDNKIAWYENQIGEDGADSDGFGEEQVISDVADEATSVYAVDLNGDDKKDVISAADADSKVAWYENQIGEDGADSDGFGEEQVVTTTADDVQSVYAADLNGNGRKDILSAYSEGAFTGDDKIAMYRNQIGEDGADSDGFAEEQVVTSDVKSPQSVYAADLDDDGKADVVSASADDGKIAWYKNGSAPPLPVEIVSLTARVDGKNTVLSWTTASETNNAEFQVQRKAGEGANGRTGAWTTVGSVEGSGTTSQAQSYRFTDDDLPYEANALTYRLKQVDTDGSAHLSDPVTIERSVDQVELLGTYPNPAQQRATVRYALPEKQKASIRLYDVLGRQVQTVVSGTQEGRHQRTLDVGSLPSGVYFLRLRAGGETRTQKLTIAR